MRSDNCESKLKYIKSIRYLRDVNDAEIALIATHVRIAKHGPGQFIYLQGDARQSLYFLHCGRIKLTQIAEDGTELLLDIVSPGEMFGEVGAILNEARSDSAQALEEVLLCEMASAGFRDLLIRQPSVSYRILKRVTCRLHETERRLARMTYQDVSTRIKETLADLVNTNPLGSQSSTSIVQMTQQDIANLIGASRQETSKALKKLKQEGVIDLKYRSIIVKSPGRLRGGAVQAAAQS